MSPDPREHWETSTVLSAFDRWGNQGLGRSNNLPLNTEQGNGFRSPSSPLQSPALIHSRVVLQTVPYLERECPFPDTEVEEPPPPLNSLVLTTLCQMGGGSLCLGQESNFPDQPGAGEGRLQVTQWPCSPWSTLCRDVLGNHRYSRHANVPVPRVHLHMLIEDHIFNLSGIFCFHPISFSGHDFIFSHTWWVMCFSSWAIPYVSHLHGLNSPSIFPWFPDLGPQDIIGCWIQLSVRPLNSCTWYPGFYAIDNHLVGGA